MTTSLRTVSPVDDQVYVERPLATGEETERALDAATRAQSEWSALDLVERQALLGDAVDAFVAKRDEIAEEITWQMGRPIRHSPGEVGGVEERASYMLHVGPASLTDFGATPKVGFTRFVRKQPLGVVCVIAPWNYPYLTAVNTVIPALMAGNAVVLKASHQTPLTAERFAEAFASAGLPAGVFQYLHLDHEATGRLISDSRTAFVSFTGSVAGGHAVQKALVGRFAGSGLELGGKDPAYVRADADLDSAIEGIVDGVYFNAGQSCCAVERIYVDAARFDDFVEGFVDLASRYVLGDPTLPETTLGPMVRASAAQLVRDQVDEAVKKGARPLLDPARFPAARLDSPYVAPQALIGVDHGMRLMTEETFGPAVGIMPVRSDDEACALMNDSPFGLSASVWTRDETRALEIGQRVRTGTFFMNRCDYLDPALAWTGTGLSGRGCTLSPLGYDQLTRPQSFHLRHAGP